MFNLKSIGLIFKILLITIISFKALAEERILSLQPYLSGPDLLEESKTNFQYVWFQKYLEKENGNYIDLPLDYNNPKLGTISIYYYTLAPFDPLKPSFIFFQGGPGGASHFMNEIFGEITEWNIIQLDYRGIGFSFPSNVETLRNTDYFSSEIVARDAYEIIKKMGIEKVSVYGHSYGTMLATIFSSLYPSVTQATVLEGTVFSGENLWNSYYRRKILQRFFDKLLKETKEKILYFSNLDINPTWFSDMGQQEMYSPNFESKLLSSLNNLLNKSEEEIIEELKMNNNRISSFLKDSLFFSSHFFNHIACKELDLSKSYSSFSFIFRDNKLTEFNDLNGKQNCDYLGVTEDKVNRYSALNYKLTKPVTYFQGTTDGATTADQSVKHYKFASIGPAQIYFAPKEGHSPLLNLLTPQTSLDPQKGQNLLFKALKGEHMNKAELMEFRKSEKNGAKWTATSKLSK